jgi:hypothetical protein
MKPKNNALARAFGFRQDDLEANRAGHISETQKQTLAQRFEKGKRLYLLIIVHSVILLIGLGAYAWTQRSNPAYFTESGLAFWLTLLITAGTVAAFTFLMVRHRQTINSEVQTGRVEKLSGDVQLQPGTTMSRHLHINGQVFKLGVQQASAFQSGELYDVYVSPQTRQILSAEPATS